jgi:hypothetical protein
MMPILKESIFGFLLILLIASCNQENNQPLPPPFIPGTGEITLQSSDTLLVQAFNWAKNQALAYVHNGEDPVGKWYEAALPNRQAFCMRDVSHQLMGANVLGLYEHNANMLYKFAVNISESKDWCSYWEINKEDKPAPVDYRNDKEFWYNLPANFDVIIAAYKHYQWTGDESILKDSVFLYFYEKSLNEYVDRWDLGLDKVSTRSRFMNMVEKVDSNDYFHMCRGIPGYDEGQRGKMTMGLDQLVIMAAAYKVGAAIMHLNNDDTQSKTYGTKYTEIKQYIDTQWWNEEQKSFATFLLDDGDFKYDENKSILFYHLNDDTTKIQLTLNDLKDKVRTLNIESASHLPEVFYNYGVNELAYEALLYLSDEQTKRREYPEVSYAVMGSIANGMFGIDPDATNNTVTTLPRLTDKTDWAEILNIPVLQNKITIKHNGNSETTLTNDQGGEFLWQAKFIGHYDEILIDNKKAKLTYGKDLSGQEITKVETKVKPGKTIHIEAKK